LAEKLGILNDGLPNLRLVHKGVNIGQVMPKDG